MSRSAQRNTLWCSGLEVAVLTCLLATLWSCDNGSLPDQNSSGDRGVVYTEERDPCAAFNPYRNLYFGDLHAHTGLSHETWLLDVHSATRDALRFARGEPIALPPLDEHGSGTRPVRLDRPLDFAAVTDHGEFLAEVEACVTPGSNAYDSLTCTIYRQNNFLSEPVMAFPTATKDPQRSRDICGAQGVDCPAMAAQVWGRVRDEVEAEYDRTPACSFTAFVGYEYTGMPGAANLHRNVIFRNASIPELPVSYFEEPEPYGLLDALEGACLSGVPHCEVIAIPHNSNESNGNKFTAEYPGAGDLEQERRLAALRGRMEPLVEIFQHKGDSECMNGLAGVSGPPDELCDFEKLRVPPFADCGEGTGFGGMLGLGCVSRLDFVRYALLAGLKEEERLGVNPYKLGIIASTDTHNAAPGLVSEQGYPGHWGIKEDTPEERLGPSGITHRGVVANPGGLTAVWAVENSRDAIFEAFRRRETYATSGPRISVRFFGGWEYPKTMCGDSDYARVGYQKGTPMGGDLPPESGASSHPTFFVLALQDQGRAAGSGTPLQRIQVVKGWVDREGLPRQKVFEVAGDPLNLTSPVR